MSFLLISSKQALYNVLRNAVRPGYAGEMLSKLWQRVRGNDEQDERAKSIDWCKDKAEDTDAWAEGIDPTLWEQAKRFSSAQEDLERERVLSLGVDLGGGGFYTLLYFVTRLCRPEYAVETGVAAGHSSRSILKAMEENGTGHLWSSDFPMFRLDDPEQFIGVMVESDLRSRWTLLAKGDRKNIPEICEQAPHIDLFHYDSDKTRRGREFALACVKPKLKPDSIIMFDDIQDNLQFKELVARENATYKVFCFKGKWVGLIVPSGSSPLA